jgi:hypothetical protein
MEMVVSVVDGTPVPTILFGFHDQNFSQAVYIQVDEDPLKCVEMANHIHEQFIAACGESVKRHNAAKNLPEPGTTFSNGHRG